MSKTEEADKLERERWGQPCLRGMYLDWVIIQRVLELQREAAEKRQPRTFAELLASVIRLPPS